MKLLKQSIKMHRAVQQIYVGCKGKQVSRSSFSVHITAVSVVIVCSHMHVLSKKKVMVCGFAVQYGVGPLMFMAISTKIVFKLESQYF